MTETEKKKIRSLASIYGYSSQSYQLIEEMAELTQAISKYWKQLCSRKTTVDVESPGKQRIKEEIADVTICIEQVKYLLSIEEEEMGKIVNQKLDKQMELTKKRVIKTLM